MDDARLAVSTGDVPTRQAIILCSCGWRRRCWSEAGALVLAEYHAARFVGVRSRKRYGWPEHVVEVRS